MARIRRPAEESRPEHAAIGHDLTPADHLDPRLYVDPNVPDAVKANPLDLLRWARLHMPQMTKTAEEARAERESLDAQHRWRRACMEARRAGRPLPELEEFLPGVERFDPAEPSS